MRKIVLYSFIGILLFLSANCTKDSHEAEGMPIPDPKDIPLRIGGDWSKSAPISLQGRMETYHEKTHTCGGDPLDCVVVTPTDIAAKLPTTKDIANYYLYGSGQQELPLTPDDYEALKSGKKEFHYVKSEKPEVHQYALYEQ